VEMACVGQRHRSIEAGKAPTSCQAHRHPEPDFPKCSSFGVCRQGESARQGRPYRAIARPGGRGALARDSNADDLCARALALQIRGSP